MFLTVFDDFECVIAPTMVMSIPYEEMLEITCSALVELCCL